MGLCLRALRRIAAASDAALRITGLWINLCDALYVVPEIEGPDAARFAPGPLPLERLHLPLLRRVHQDTAGRLRRGLVPEHGSMAQRATGTSGHRIPFAQSADGHPCIETCAVRGRPNEACTDRDLFKQ